MKKLMALRFLFCLVIYIAILIFTTSQTIAFHKVYKENFEAENLSNWTVKRNIQYSNTSQPCLYGGSPATWNVENGKAGIKINGPSCTTEIIPNNFNLSGFADYSYSFDMEFKNTAVANRNILFKYLDSSNWYDFMTYGSTIYFQKVVGSYYRVESKSYSFLDNQNYHFKIEFVKNKIKLFINDIEVWTLEDSAPYFNGGTVGLQASVGADPDSETWFDNIVVTNIDAPLDVPLLKQTDSLWGDDEYDSASTWAKSGEPITINRWGCAMTSAAMILKYHGINKLPDGSPVQPDTLNIWLKNYEDNKSNKIGYIRGAVNWAAIADLSKLAKTINNITAFNALEFVWGDNDTTKLKNQLDSNNPVILEVPNHFIVAKGINGDTFDINDPFYDDRHTLKDGYNNSYFSSRRYIPSFTNLSYLIVVVDPDVDMYLTNNSGQKTGSNGTTTYTDIPNAIYYLQRGIKDPVSGQISPDFRMLLIPKPTDDTYNITVATTSASINQFKLESYRHTATGSATVNNISSQTKIDEPATFSLSFQQNPSTAPSAPTDTTPPQIKSTKTLDTNNNGKIDTIEVTFVKPINKTSINKKNLDDFTVDGYTIIEEKAKEDTVITLTLEEKLTTDTGVVPKVTMVKNAIMDKGNDAKNNLQTATPTDGIPPTKPTVDIPGDKYLTPQKVTLVSLDVPNTPTIYYTLDGSDPATSSAKLTYTILYPRIRTTC